MRTGIKLLAAAVAFGAAVLGSGAASANPISFVYSIDGGANYVTFGTSLTGTLAATTTVGTYTITGLATGSPTMPAPNFQSTSIDVKSSGSGTLIVAAVESGLTTPGIVGFNLGFTSNALSTLSVTETFAVINSSNVYTALANSTLAPNTASATSVAYTPSPNYSVVELYTINFGAGGGTVNATIAENGISVPEPVSMSLLGAGLAGLGLIRLRRKSV